MKYHLLLMISLFVSGTMLAQDEADDTGTRSYKRKLGIRVGANFSTVHVKKASDLQFKSRQGLMVSGFYAPAARGFMGFRTEVVYSRQGFEFATDDGQTIVANDYLLFPQFTTINISRFFQLQLGGQVGYLLSAKSRLGPLSLDMKDMTNRIDYGAAGGLEIYPFKGLIVGGRYSMSFGNVYKQMAEAGEPGEMPVGNFDFKSRNGVISLFLGYQF